MATENDNKLYCPECGEEVKQEFIYETGDTLCTCKNCGWEGNWRDAEDAKGHNYYYNSDEIDRIL